MRALADRERIQRLMEAFGRAARADVRVHLVGGATAGDLPPDIDPATLARYVMTVNYGIAVQAAVGASRDQLDRVIDDVITSLPPSGAIRGRQKARRALSVRGPRPRRRG